VGGPVKQMDRRLQEIADGIDASFDDMLEFLDSPAGRRLRRVLATSLIASVPLVMRIPGLRASPIGRLLTVTGGATMVVKLAEAIRDWERALPEHQVIDVPRVT
jgi:hypothetical protein